MYKISKDSLQAVLIEYRRKRLHLFLILFLSYVGFYFCRVDLLAALPLIEEGFHYSKTQTGVILSSYFIVYSAGKIINGLLGSRIGGKALLLIGIGGSVICNTIFGFGKGLPFFITTWSANAFFQSMGWLAIMSIMSHWYISTETGRAVGIISLSYLLGDFAARLSAGMIIGRDGAQWSEPFWIHAGIFAVIGSLAWALIRPVPENIGLPDVNTYGKSLGMGPEKTAETPRSEQNEVPSDRSNKWLFTMLSNKYFWLACLIYLGLSVIRYIFWSWSIVFLRETGMATASAVVFSSVFPILGSFGAIFAGWVSDRMNARRGPILATMASCMVLSIYIFSKIPIDQPLFLIITLAIIGFTLIGPYSLLAGAMAIDFGSKYSASAAAGIIDGVGAVGAALSGVGMGFLIDKHGWNGAFMIVIAIAFATAALCFSLWNLKPLSECAQRSS